MTAYLGALLLTGGFVGFFVWLGWLAGKNGEEVKRRDLTEAALNEAKEMKEHEAKLHSGPRRTLSAIARSLRETRDG